MKSFIKKREREAIRQEINKSEKERKNERRMQIYIEREEKGKRKEVEEYEKRKRTDNQIKIEKESVRREETKGEVINDGGNN